MRKIHIISGQPEEQKDKHTGDKEGRLKEAGSALLELVLQPLLILFKIPQNLLTELYKGVCLYSVQIPVSIGRFLFLPVNLFISAAQYLSFGHVDEAVKRFIGRSGALLRKGSASLRMRWARRGNLGRKLKIYEQVVAQVSGLDGAFAREYSRKKYCFLFAFFLQLVSFFTTYAGLELYFGGVFYLAPFLIAVVVQGALYTSVITVFRPGKHRAAMAACLLVFVSCSVVFSYTGLITLYHSPEKDYGQAYETYAEAFEQARSEAMGRFKDTEQAITELMKAVDTIEAGEELADQQIRVLKSRQAAVEIPPQFINSRSVTVSGNGSRTTTNSAVANEGYQAAINRMDAINEELAFLESGRRPAARFLEGYDEPTIRGIMEAAADGGQDEQAQEALSRLEMSFSSAALSSNELSGRMGVGELVDRDLVTKCKRDIIEYQNLERISLAQATEARLAGDADFADPNSQKQSSGLIDLIQKAGGLIGADFGNANMNELTDMRKQIQKQADSSFLRISGYDRGTPAFDSLKAAKERVDVLPGILVYAGQRLKSQDTRSDALLCLILALFNDGASVLLGFAGGRCADHRITKPKGKTYGEDAEALFGLLYGSMQSAFLMRIKANHFIGVDDWRFREICLNYVGSVSAQINEFIGRFGISECTGAQGYNRRLIYKDDDELKEFLPLISILMHAGLLKAMPLSYYQEIEYRYYLGIRFDDSYNNVVDRRRTDEYVRKMEESKGKGHVLLLKNTGEEYMMRQMGYSMIMEGVQQS